MLHLTIARLFVDGTWLVIPLFSQRQKHQIQTNTDSQNHETNRSRDTVHARVRFSAWRSQTLERDYDGRRNYIMILGNN